MSTVVNCSVCQHIVTPFYKVCPKCEGERNRSKVEDLASVIRELKSSIESPVSADKETYLMKRLHSLGHPDVSGFMTWLDEARKPGGKTSPRKGWQR